MLDFKRGDVFQSQAQVLVNPVNCTGVTGKGLARGFELKRPLETVAYKVAAAAGLLKPGTLFIVPSSDGKGGKYVVHLPTKTIWQKDSELDYVRSGVAKLAKFCSEQSIRSVALPWLGCGENTGKLNRRDVEAVFVELLTSGETVFTVYEY